MNSIKCVLLIAVVALMPLTAQAKAWDQAVIKAALEKHIGEDLELRGYTLTPDTLQLEHSWGFRESVNHVVMDWTFGQLFAVLSDGTLWDDVVEQFTVTFTAESAGQVYKGKSYIAVLRYEGNDWLIQYYQSDYALVATEVLFPKYRLTLIEDLNHGQ